MPLHDATAAQVNRAIALVHEARKGGARIPADWQAKAKRLSSALPGTGHGQRVRVTRDRQGRVAMTFTSVPVEEIEAFIAALREHLGSGTEP